MGGVCSGGSVLADEKPGAKVAVVSTKVNSVDGFAGRQSSSFPPNGNGFEITKQKGNSNEFKSRRSSPLALARKVPSEIKEKSLLLGKGARVSLKKSVKAFVTLDSRIPNLNGVASKCKKVSILAFEVANTIVKGANLLQSLSEKNVKLLKEDILASEGVRNLVSADMKELLLIAAADKREELDVFSREVIRFGEQCNDLQWHNLGQYFSKLDSENIRCKVSRDRAETSMQQLSYLAQLTSGLYHELNVLDRLERDYQSKLQEAESYNLPQEGEDLANLRSEQKFQKKYVKRLKKRSLWSMTMEEIVMKFVDIVIYMHQKVVEAFGDNGTTWFIKESDTTNGSLQRLGKAGLALHYANIVRHIDIIAAHPSALTPNIRDTLYNSLPTSIRTALRFRLHSVDPKEQPVSISHVKAELDKTLIWLVPLVTNTIRANERFGWIGDWAKASEEISKHMATSSNPIRLQTLYHVNREKLELYILELVVCLHWIIILVKQRIQAFRPMPIRSAIQKGKKFQLRAQPLSYADHNGLRTPTPRTKPAQEGESPMQEAFERRFPFASKGEKDQALSKSSGSSPVKEFHTETTFKGRTITVFDVMD